MCRGTTGEWTRPRPRRRDGYASARCGDATRDAGRAARPPHPPPHGSLAGPRLLPTDVLARAGDPAVGSELAGAALGGPHRDVSLAAALSGAARRHSGAADVQRRA